MVPEAREKRFAFRLLRKKRHRCGKQAIPVLSFYQRFFYQRRSSRVFQLPLLICSRTNDFRGRQDPERHGEKRATDGSQRAGRPGLEEGERRRLHL